MWIRDETHKYLAGYVLTGQKRGKDQDINMQSGLGYYFSASQDIEDHMIRNNSQQLSRIHGSWTQDDSWVHSASE